MKPGFKQKDVNFLTIVCFAILFSACEYESTNKNSCSNPTSIVLIRHAEKVDESNDPDLSLAGHERAVKLKNMLADWNPNYFFSTNYIRTLKTVEPLADFANLPMDLYSSDTLNEFAARLRNTSNARIIVSGHSNTTPQLVNYLIDKEAYEQLADNEYGKLFFVTLCDGKAIDWFVLNF